MIRTIEFRIFPPAGGFPLKRIVRRAPQGQAFTADGIEHESLRIGEQLESEFPRNFWRAQRIADSGSRAVVNVVWAWEEAGALQAAMAVETVLHAGRSSALVQRKIADFVAQREAGNVVAL